MSVKIRIQYTEQSELDQVLDLLRPLGMNVKMPKRQDEKLRCYLSANGIPDTRPTAREYPKPRPRTHNNRLDGQIIEHYEAK